MTPQQGPIIDMALVRAKTQAAVAEALNASMLILSSSIRTMLSQPGTGRQYRRSAGIGRRARNARQAGVHVASAPGRPPAVDTNRLRASFTVSSVPKQGSRSSGTDAFVANVQEPTRTVLTFGSRVPYAVFLEFGTRRVRRRPYIAPTLEKFRPRLPAIFAASFMRHFPKGNP
jgi:hypothetical protein